MCALSVKTSNTQQMEKSKKGEEDEASAIDGRKSMSSAGAHRHKPPVSIKANAIVNNLKEEEKKSPS